MSDDLPTEERLGRIERGVQRRIDARRVSAQRVVRGVSGGAVAVLLVVGGFALIRPSISSPSGAAGASSGRSAASALVPVRCHDGATTTTTRAARAGLPASAIAACTTVRFSANSAPEVQGASGAPRPVPTPPSSVLCRAEDGALQVYFGGTASCATHGTTPYAG